MKYILFNNRFTFIKLIIIGLFLCILETTLWKDFTSLHFLNSDCDTINSNFKIKKLYFLTSFVKFSVFAGLLWVIFNGKNLYLDLKNLTAPFVTSSKIILLTGIHLAAFLVMVALNGYKESFCVFSANLHPNTIIIAFLSSGIIYTASTILLFAPVVFWFNYFKKNLKQLSMLMIFMWTLAYLATFHSFNLTFFEKHLHYILFPITAGLVISILDLLHFPTSSDLTLHQISINEFSVEITPKCLGYEGVVIVMLVLSVYFYFNRNRLNFPNILLIYPLISTILFLLNSLRIAVLLIIGAQISPDIAILGFHSASGWFELLTILGLSILLVNKSPFFSKLSTQYIFDFSSNKAQLAPQVLLIFCSLFSILLSPGFEWTYPVKVVVVGLFIWSCWPKLNLQFSKQLFLSVVMGVVTFVIWIVLVPLDEEKSIFFASKLFAIPQWGVILWMVFRVFGSVIIIPLAEELAFRGYLFAELKDVFASRFKSYPQWIDSIIVIIITSIGFGLLHSALLAAILSGIIFGFIRLYKNNVLDAVICHGVANLLLSAYVIYYSAWSLW